MATSILIRTFVADGEELSLHVGGGMTWRSDPAAEWDETVATAGGPLRFQKPVIFQIDDGGRRHPVEGGYVHRSPHQIGFRVGTYDRTRPLIIDPVLSYSTYLGGSGYDEGNSIAVDATGAVYVTGTTASTDFPTVNAVQPTPNESGLDDIYVAKITPANAIGANTSAHTPSTCAVGFIPKNAPIGTNSPTAKAMKRPM